MVNSTLPPLIMIKASKNPGRDTTNSKTTTMKRRRIAHGTNELNYVRYECTASH